MLRERRRQANYKPNRRLDRKSSRGMIYENEELRLRTMNINAEVERGQSDLRKLRRENEQLRREIWSLRDEYDKLNKIFKTTTDNIDNNQCNIGDGKNCCANDEDDYHNCSGGESDSQSDNSGSCDCDKHDNNDSDWYDNEINNSTEQQNKIESSPIKIYNSNTNTTNGQQQNKMTDDEEPGPSRSNINENCYDHLSVVSEETLQNSENNESNYMHQQQLMTFSPTSPTDQLIPPLSHFENIIEKCYSQNEDLNSHSGGTTSSSTTTGETVIDKQSLNDWDFNLQSPFLQRKQYHLLQQQMQLTTFTCAPATSITTTSTTTSPKHFFSPLKPKVHLKSLQAMISEIPTLSSSQPSIESLGTNINDTSLANNTLKTSLNTILAADLSWDNKLKNNYSYNTDKSYKPDICVSNVLGSPLRRETKDGTTQKRQQQNRESYFQNGGNLEDLLQDIELLSSDILKMQLEKTVTSSAESISTNSAAVVVSDINKSLDNISKNGILEPQNNNSFDNKDRKPYRSEMNLVLNYNGQNPVFVPTSRPGTPLPTQSTTISTIKKILQHANSENDLLNGNKSHDVIDSSLNYSNINLPSDIYQDQRSQIPRPMTLFPENHNYLGFEPIDRQLQEPCINLNTSIPIPISPLIISPPPPSPSPSTFGGHFYHNAPVLSINKLKEPVIVQQAIQKSLKNSTEPKTATINSASMKRSQFSKSRSDNLTGNDNITTDKDSTDYPQISVTADNPIGKTSAPKEAKIMIVPSLSIQNEDNSLPTPSTVRKQNSLHSSNENKEHQPQCKSRNNSGNTNAKRQNHRHHHHHHHHQQKSNFNRKLSQESSAAESNTESLICGVSASEPIGNKTTKENDLLKLSSTSSGSSPANKINHNSRRNSEGLLTPSTSSHHHHHHHHPRNNTLNDSHHDLFSGGTSISERNSNSLGSSRESSATSLSLRSQKNSHQRKISISSHNDGTGPNGGGKIPWCACWGNGCL